MADDTRSPKIHASDNHIISGIAEATALGTPAGAARLLFGGQGRIATVDLPVAKARELRDQLDEILGTSEENRSGIREPSPGLETTVAEALRSVRVEDCDMLEILFAAARDLEWSAPDALGAAEQRLDHLAAHLADAVGSAFPPGLASGASESPGDLGEETGVQRFDPRDPEQTLDAIIDLGRRICVLEGWRRSCAHLPADEEALGALVDEAVERALRPVAHRMSDLESMKINLQGRVHALELHRQGLTDGQAELAAGGLEVTIGGKEHRTAPDGSLSPADEQDYAAAREKSKEVRVDAIFRVLRGSTDPALVSSEGIRRTARELEAVLFGGFRAGDDSPSRSVQILSDFKEFAKRLRVWGCVTRDKVANDLEKIVDGWTDRSPVASRLTSEEKKAIEQSLEALERAYFESEGEKYSYFVENGWAAKTLRGMLSDP